MEIAAGSVQIGAVLSHLVCQIQDHAGSGNAHIAAPVIFGNRHPIRVALGKTFHFVGFFQNGSLCTGVEVRVRIHTVHSENGNITIVSHFHPVHAILHTHAFQRSTICVLTGSTPHLCCCPVAFVNIGSVAIITSRNVRRIREDKVGIFLQECPRVLCSIQTLFRKVLVDLLVVFICHCHRCTEIGSRCGGNRRYDQFVRFRFRHHITGEILAADLVVHAAGLAVLHFQHPFQFIACLVQHIRNTVAAFRNANAVAEQLRIGIIGNQQVCHRLCTGNNISAVVAGIMPAAADIDFFVGVIKCCQRVMASHMPECAVLHLRAAPLEVQHFHAVVQQTVVNVITNGERIRLIQTAAGDIVCTSFCYGGEISRPVVFIGGRIKRRSRQFPGIDHLSAVCVDDGKIGFTGHVAEHSCLGFVRLITYLIGHDRRSIRLDRSIIHVGIIYQFYLYIVQINSMCRQIFLVFQSAVEHQLGHDI